MPGLPYDDRTQAGRALAAELQDLRGQSGLLVLALPRGGVPVAHEVAQMLAAPLDVFVVRKLGHPLLPEFAVGALASGGLRVLMPLPGLDVPDDVLEQVIARESAVLQRREALYRAGRAPLEVRGRIVWLVDDGLATGATMEAAVRALRQREPSQLCVAVPVGSPEGCERIAAIADRMVCPAQPEPFRAVSVWYRSFEQTSDDEVCRLLGLRG
jgi:putative phosphoribosyl transferase